MTTPPLAAAELQDLARRLQSEAPSPLTAPERRLLVSALDQLAAEASLALDLERLLMLHDESDLDVRSLAARAMSMVRDRVHDPALARDYDHDAARRARAALAQAVESARTGRETIAAALAFARDMAILLK